MFEKIKYNLAHFILRKKYLTKKKEQILFKNVITNSNTFFVIMPSDNKEFDKSLAVIDYLLANQKVISVFLHQNQEILLNENGIFALIKYDDESKNRINLPIRSFINLLNSKHYDVVINLNRGREVFLNSVANIVKSKIRVGFENEKTEDYYDIQIANSSTGPEEIYQYYINLLKMF